MSLALIYLSRGIDGGLDSAKAFFNAYRKFPAGCIHDLIVIVKGWSGVDGLDELRQLAQKYDARLVDLPDDGFDWGAYMRLAPLLSHDWLCFLNTQSRPRVEGWLNLLMIAANKPDLNIGAIGATGSWGTLAPILPQISMKAAYNNVCFYPMRLLNNLVFFVVNFREFPLFPNPHLRSNAFIVRRNLFVDFIETHKIPRRKRDAYILESGRKGFSMFLSKRGLKIMVAGADGKIYGPDQWINSRTFRSTEQSNLLVADNQTMFYDKADRWMKYGLEKAAWGRALVKI